MKNWVNNECQFDNEKKKENAECHFENDKVRENAKSCFENDKDRKNANRKIRIKDIIPLQKWQRKKKMPSVKLELKT